MSLKAGRITTVVLCLACLLQSACASATQAGFRIESLSAPKQDHPILIDWWYPTQGQNAEAINYGLGRGVAVEAGEIVPGRHPLVVLSHGALGAPRNYSWVAEALARAGFVVAGIAHYGESYLYGEHTIDPEAVLRSWQRPQEISTALSLILEQSSLAKSIDAKRIGLLGHSSGGATALYLAGAGFSETRMGAYCRSKLSLNDRGCDYASDGATQSISLPPSSSLRSHPDRRFRAFVALDPAIGPGFSDYADVLPATPLLIIGSVDNDFLPYSHHAEAIAAELPQAQTLWLTNGEGHFVYLNDCDVDLNANGVPLCEDRDGVSRSAVHAKLNRTIIPFFHKALGGGELPKHP